MQAFYIDENAVRIMLEIPDDATNLTESLNSSRTVGLLLKQHEEQCKQNKRLFWVSIITSLISTGALVVSIIALV